MKILNIVQGSNEWLDARKEHFTASDASAMMNESKYKTRDQLLREKKGWSEPVSKAKQAIFDKGHETEELAREIIETNYLEEFAPIVGSVEVQGLKLLASLDGLSESQDLIYEHKLYNAVLAENVKHSVLEASHYWQLEHQCLVFGVDKVLFVTSDGTPDKWEEMTYTSEASRRLKLIAGWKQFAIDLEAFELKAKHEAVEVIEAVKCGLPAINYSVTGTEISTNIGGCLDQIKEIAKVEMSKTLDTDQDFADKDQLNKDVKKARAGLKETIAKVRGEFVSYSEFEEIAIDLDSVLQKMQAHGEKQVKDAKAAKKQAISLAGEQELIKLSNECDAKLSPMKLAGIIVLSMPDFDLAMKGKRTIESLENAVSSEVASAKITINQVMGRVMPNLEYLREHAEEYKFLFNDAQQLVNQESEPFQAIVKQRISEHKQAEADRLEQERKRIQIEEEAKAKKIADDKLEAEREEIRKQEREKLQAEAKAAPAPKQQEEVIPPQIESNEQYDQEMAEGAHNSLTGSVAGDAVLDAVVDTFSPSKCLDKIMTAEEKNKALRGVLMDWANRSGINPESFDELNTIMDFYL